MLKMSLSAWSKPSRSIFRRIIALSMAVSFLFPAMSWAFQIQAYDTDPGTAAVPEVTPNVGKVISANQGTTGATLYLVQDLHCNYEVQTNIRRILGELKKKNSDLKLVAVEGATGIIPTRKLAGLPNTPAKRAVAAYFMREGKLTGADVLAICDQPQVELFGAENRSLYSQSLSLIQEFVTESNRGLVFELMDRIKFLQARVYNPKLLAFEKQRDAMLLGRVDVRDYHNALMREALQMNVPLALDKFNGSGGGWDLYERTLLDRVLESKIRTHLLKTAEEKQLSAEYLYVEAAEHILSISASQAEVESFKAASQTQSLTAIQKSLQASFRKMDYYAGVDPSFGEEVAALEKSMQKGMRFYQLSQERNTALFEKATARMRARGEQKAALVTGGFHTEGIAQLARAQGYSVVVVRPRQENPEAANKYFLRLRYPDQPTKLESLVAKFQTTLRAIAPPNEVAKLAVVFPQEVAAVEGAAVAAQSSDLGKAIISEVRGTQAPEVKIRDFVSKPGVRILGLSLLGATLSAFMVQIIAGVALTPLVIVAGAALLIVGAWAAAKALNLTWAQVATRKNVLLGSVLAGSAVFSAWTGSLLSSAIQKMVNVSKEPSNAAARVIGLAVRALHVLGGTVYHQDPELAGRAALKTLGLASNVLVGSIFSGPIRLAMGVTQVLMLRNPKSSQAVLRMTFKRARAEAYETKIADAEENELGFEYLEHNMQRPAQGAIPLLEQDDVDEMMEVLNNLGIVKFEGAMPVDYAYKFMELIKGDHMMPSPIQCETEFKPTDGWAQLVHRIIVTDYLFTDSDGANLNLTAMPQKDIEGILSALVPSAYDRAYSAAELEELFTFAGKLGPAFLNFFKAAVEKSRTQNIPLTLKTLIEFLKQGLLHEANHGLVLHLAEPDLIPPGTVSEEVMERYKKISVKAYLNLINTHLTQDPDWQTSAVFIKNLFKAMVATKDESRKKGPSWDAKEKNNYFLAQLITEMFNDRFEIFELETNAKMEAYKTALGLDYQIPLGMLRDLEKDMNKTLSEGPGQNSFQKKHEVTPEKFAVLKKALVAAATESSVYVGTFKDPVLSEAELVFYNNFLDHLLHFEKDKKKNSILQFSMEHTNGLLFKILKTSMLKNGKIGMADALQLSEQMGVEGPLGLAVGVLGTEEPVVTTLEDALQAAKTLQPAAETVKTEPVKPSAPVLLDMSIEDTEPEPFFEPVALGISHLGAAHARALEPAEINQALEERQPVAANNVNFSLDMSFEDAETQPAEKETATAANKNEHAALALQSIQQQKQVVAQGATVKETRTEAASTDDEVGNFGKIGAGARMLSAPRTEAVVSQPATAPQIDAANQSLAPSRAAQLLPGLFDLWNTQPGPPPHLGGPNYYLVTNDPFLGIAVAELVNGQPAPGISPQDWAAFGRSLQVQIINPAQSEPVTGKPGVAGAHSAADLGKLKYADALNQLLNATPAGIPAPGTVNGLVVVTPGNGNQGLDTTPASLGTQAGLVGKGTSAGTVAGVQNLTVGESAATAGTTEKNAAAVNASENVQAAQVRLDGQPGTTGMVFSNGKVGIPLQVVSVPMNQLLAGPNGQKSFENVIEKSNALKKELVNASQFGDALLLTQDQMRSTEVQDLLGEGFNQSSNLVQVLVDASAANLLQTQLGARGYQQVLALRKLIDAQTAQLKAAFAAGAKAVPVAMDTVSIDTMKKLAASLAHGNLAIFGSNASSLLAKMAAFPGLNEIGKAAGLAAAHAGNTQLLADAMALDNPLSEDLDALEESVVGNFNASGKETSALSALAGQPTTAEQAAEFADLLKAQDQVLYLTKGGSHAAGVEEKSLLTSNSAYLELVQEAENTSNPEKVFAGGEAIPELVKTTFLSAKGWLRTFSAVALGVAALTLVGRSLRDMNSPLSGKGFKGQRLPIIPIMTHPSFIRAVRLMARIVVGNYGDRDVLDPLVRQQLADLRQLEAKGVKVADLKVGSAEIPTSLRYSLTHLVWLKNFLGQLPFFNSFLKFRGINLDTLNPELLMLVNEFLSMEGITWYFAKQTYMLKQIEAHKAVMDPTLWNFLMLSPQDLQSARQAHLLELRDLRKAANPTSDQQKRQAVLTVEIRHLNFADRFQKQIARMDKDNNPRFTKNLLTLLLGQLSRRDVTDQYADSILSIISMIDPDNRTAVQMTAVREGQVKTLYMNLPNILKDSAVHLELFMLHFPLLYDDKGHPITAPEINHIHSAEQSA